MSTLRYEVYLADPSAHLYEVVLTIPAPSPEGQHLQLAAWIPGSYMIRDFARNIVRIEATSGGNPIALCKLGKDAWQAAPTDGPLQVRCQVYAWEHTVRTAVLDSRYAFFNGTSLFLRPKGHESAPCELVLHPALSLPNWRVAVALDRKDANDGGFGTYAAPSWDALVDAPVLMGPLVEVDFIAGGVPHRAALVGRFRCDLDRLAADLTAVCEAQQALFGSPPPMDRYLFQVMVTGDGYGGLEHRASTALVCKRDDLPQPGITKVTDGYRTFLGLCSHEYFHTWNVKRIKPAAFTPYDYQSENHTTLLWAFEGITSYYDDLGLLRAGLIDASSWLELLGRTTTRVLRTPGRKLQSVAESSFDAWTKFYRQDENAPNAIVSYYTKGALLALCLDLTLRQRTQERVGLDTLMRAMWERYGRGEGVPERAIEALAAELAGEDLTDFFDLAVRGTEDLPLAELLAWVGLGLGTRPAAGDDDKGGTPPKPTGSTNPDPGDLGVHTRPTHGGSELRHVIHGGAAWEAGLSAGDVVVALDGLRVGSHLRARAAALPPGAVVTLHAFRGDELHTFEATLKAPELDTAWITIDPDATKDAEARRERWLRGAVSGG